MGCRCEGYINVYIYIYIHVKIHPPLYIPLHLYMIKALSLYTLETLLAPEYNKCRAVTHRSSGVYTVNPTLTW